MANGLPIDLETFEALPERQQNIAIYKVLVYMVQSDFESAPDREEKRKSCEARFQVLEQDNQNPLKKYGLVTGAGGVGAGILVIFDKILAKLLGG